MTPNKLKIVFFGTSSFALPALKTLSADPRIDIKFVVTKPDKPAGRGMKIDSSPVKKLAQELGLKIEEPEKVREIIDELTAAEPDLFVLATYGKLIPEEALKIPRHGSLNIHPSLLPELRGPSPIQSAILTGKKETGVTIMEMVKEMDAGPIVIQEKTTIEDQEKGTELHDRLATLGAELLEKTLFDFAGGKIKVQEQDHSKATFSKIFDNKDYELDLNEPAEKNILKIRAFADSPGAYTFENGKRLKIFAAKIADEKLVPTEFQYEGKKRQVS